MTEFFDWVGEFFTNLAEMIQHFFVSLIHFFELLIGAIQSWYSALAIIPLWLRMFGTMTLTVSVIYLLIGRNTGK